MDTDSLDNILESLPQVNTNRNYWFFRTNGGAYYDSFKEGNFIAIGYNQISVSEINSGNTRNETGVKILTEVIKKKIKNDKRPGYAASQLLRFAYGIKKGDIVLIPSDNSDNFTFGQVLETQFYLAEEGSNKCKFTKRKKVKWIKTLSRERLDPNLYKLMFSHHAISVADEYAEYIDKIINSFFLKGQDAHLVLDVQTMDEVKAKDLFQMGALSLELLDDFIDEEELPYNSDNVNLKLNVQSPGFIELAGNSMQVVLLLGLILVGVAGGGFFFNYKKDVKVGLKSDGIIEKIRHFLNSSANRKAKRELLEKHLNNLQIKDPQDLIKVLRELDK
jgi:restriction system protein